MAGFSSMKDWVLKRTEKARSSWLHKRYFFDWVTTVALFVVVQILSMILRPFDRYLPPNSPEVAYPDIPDIVPNWALFVIAAFIPVIVLVAFQIFSKQRSAHEFHHALLAFVTSFLITLTITTALKMAGGRYRPDWLSTYASGNLNEGRYSFPSGHSSLSFAGMVFLSLYLTGKRKLLRRNDSTATEGLICMSPLVLAFFVAISRTMDYHHNFSDVIAGSLIGAGVTLFCYHLYFPSLMSKRSGEPKWFTHAIDEALPVLSQVKPDANLSLHQVVVDPASVVNPPPNAINAGKTEYQL